MYDADGPGRCCADDDGPAGVDGPAEPGGAAYGCHRGSRGLWYGGPERGGGDDGLRSAYDGYVGPFGRHDELEGPFRGPVGGERARVAELAGRKRGLRRSARPRARSSSLGRVQSQSAAESAPRSRSRDRVDAPSASLRRLPVSPAPGHAQRIGGRAVSVFERKPLESARSTVAEHSSASF